uniref:F-box domain-containing protein n=1 Tax=Oryza barthii TaxID=65489 RepID=A0A0D3HJF0_9ORYZ
MPPKRKGLTSKKMAEAREKGGIDVLPDALLQHILSFLSADKALKTSVLSRRWRHLWKSTPTLRIVKTEDRWDWESFEDFNRFVNILLLYRGSAPLSMFELEFSSLGGYEFDLGSTIFRRVVMWIMYALICQVRVLKIHNFMLTQIEMDGSMPLVSQHLMKIELSGIVFGDCFLDFSSCPLNILASTWPNSVIISTLTFMHQLYPDILWGRVPFLKSIPSLLTGFVRAQQDCDDYCSNTYSGNCENCNGCLCMIDETGNDSAKCMLLGGLLEAKNLELIAEPEMSLLLNEWCVANNFRALACILKQSPVLENFTLQISKREENYNVLVKPVVTSKHLKVVKVHCTEVDDGIYKIVKFLTTLNIEVVIKRMDRSAKLFSFEEESIGSDLEEESSTRAPARRTAPEEVPDHVSALPDEALHAVLSLLPAHDAVRTCVLARRWRHLWEHAPALRVTDVEGWNPRLRGEAGLRKFIRFVDGLFVSRRRCDAPLELCDLDFDFPEEDKGKDWHVNRWIMVALLRHHARVLRISLPAYVALPDVPLISQRLTRRDLNLLLACHTFAKLKTLVLGEWCMTHDLSALIRFLQQSPILEKLTIKIPKEPKCSMDAGQQKIPEEPFVSNHLKIVEIKCKGKEVMWSTLRLVATRGARARHLFDGAPRPASRAMASGADRISDLPEDVLHHVLSLLSSRDAVRTCVLAQRWRDLWRSVHAVRVAGARGWASADAFVLFVDRLLRLRRGHAALDTCDLDLRFDGPFPSGERHGNRWIHRALRRQVRVLRLTTLELKGVLGNNQVLDFSSCPSLVDLKMENCYVGGLEMWSPTVRNLSMRYCFFYSNYRARIDFPSLVSFKFNKNLGRTPLLERMPSLATATVRLDHFCDDRCSNGRYDDCGDAECKGCHDYYAPSDYGCVFLEGLTEAKDLKLSAYSDVYLFNRDLKCCSIFRKLKNLVLNAWFVAPDLSALTWFLQYAPLLERLTLKVSEAPNNLVETEGSYSQLEQSFAASHLQIVEIKCKEVHGIILKILEVLNANGIPLEKISIRCSGRFKFVCTGIDSEN